MQDLSITLGKTFSAGWPSWRSIRGGVSNPGPSVNFTIRLADHLREEAGRMMLSTDPATIITEMREESQRGGTAAFADVWSQLENSLILLVYGSNMIELAGTNLRITIKLCQDIFRGKDVSPDLEDRDPEYQECLENLVKTHRKENRPNVIQSRREVINHAKALNFLIDRVVLDNMVLSEELILETHHILYENVDENVEAGKYRDHEVAVSYSKPGEKRKSSICLRAKAVPRYMKEMVEHLNHDITKAEISGELDPYTLAARYHHQFVMIHPFGDGNGRMSRIILNVLLLKYAGHVTTFGSDDEEKEEYLAVVGRCRKIFDEEDMEVDYSEQTSHVEFARSVLTKSKAGLEHMWGWATRRGKSTT
ncbi:Filamentation induced by cAMP/death on curing-related protein [Pleurostoma richardsiae]|uniref:Filamentation induced by cAMP/death on curing-related protein n=1 Tax=Pleurostoma richardsiae TaxID=41990 RepID=A0AA38S4V7_9PEZI|nr:Filamentation induced by cAMP/death on curing-related protein [Pleurostoma richardsiae]